MIDFGDVNEIFIEKVVDFGVEVLLGVFDDVNLCFSDIDMIVIVIVIGVVVLFLDVWIVGWFGLCFDVWWMLLFGLGCVVGVVGVVCLCDYLCGVFDDVVVLVLVEFCLLMYFVVKLIVLSLVGIVLFGDGVVVVVVVGDWCVE